jgi:hypothetical protein
MKQIMLLVCQLVVLSTLVFGQGENMRDKAIRVFLDCNWCDVEHIKKELTFVNYVRDRKDAQVHILFTEESTGSGGEKHTFYFIGQKEFTGQADTLSFSMPSDATRDETRTKQVNLIRMGLVRYVAKTPFADRLMISYEEQEEAKAVTDKWNSWVFQIDGSMYFNGEKYRNFQSTSIDLSAQRVTEDLKVEIEFENSFSKSSYYYEPEDRYINSKKSSLYFNHILVKSINDHWSYGYQLNIKTSIFANYALYPSLYPAVEYNLFPYSKSNRRQLRILYGAGLNQMNYIDTSFYDKMSDTMFGHRLGFSLAIVEKWGSISSSIVGSSFMPKVNFNRLEIFTSLNLRLFKGLSIRFFGEISFINDLVNIRKKEVTLDDLLTGRTQLPSNFDYWGSVGLSYSFGSIYNNVVNPRFGN